MGSNGEELPRVTGSICSLICACSAWPRASAGRRQWATNASCAGGSGTRGAGRDTLPTRTPSLTSELRWLGAVGRDDPDVVGDPALERAYVGFQRALLAVPHDERGVGVRDQPRVALAEGHARLLFRRGFLR